MDYDQKVNHSSRTLRAAAHQLRQDKDQDMKQNMQSCLIRDSSAWSWRQHHDSDRCAAVFMISFVSTVLSLRHIADIVSWLLHVLTHDGVRPTLEFIKKEIAVYVFRVEVQI
jgi:hypothetical protein